MAPKQKDISLFTTDELAQELEARKMEAAASKEAKAREANKQISAKLELARQLIDECVVLADEASVSFSFAVGDYVSGTYYGEGYEDGGYANSGWSSSNC